MNQMVSKLLTFRNITSGGGVSLSDSEDKTKMGPVAAALRVRFSQRRRKPAQSQRRAAHLFTGEMRLNC